MTTARTANEFPAARWFERTLGAALASGVGLGLLAAVAGSMTAQSNNLLLGDFVATPASNGQTAVAATTAAETPAL